MTRHRLFIEFTAGEGAMLRLLGLAERRGFVVRRAAMAEQPCGRRATLALELAPRDAGRSIDVLSRQLARLHGVTRINHEPSIIQEQAA